MIQEIANNAKSTIVSIVSKITLPASSAKIDTDKMKQVDAIIAPTHTVLSVKTIILSVLSVIKTIF